MSAAEQTFASPDSPARHSLRAAAGSPAVALSIRQPWAWLIIHAGKDIENRTWPSRVRGRVLIHAGKRMTRADYEACLIYCAGFDDYGRWWMPAYDVLREQCGGIVGEVDIVDCISASNSRWFCGDYGFVLRNPISLPFRECKGALGFFRPENVPDQRPERENP